jgi:hypothetical protein
MLCILEEGIGPKTIKSSLDACMEAWSLARGHLGCNSVHTCGVDLVYCMA